MKTYHALFALLFYFSMLNCKHFTVENLTLEQKIGQLFMVAAVADEEIAHNCITNKPYRMDEKYIIELIKDYHIGGIIFLGKSDKKKQIQRTKKFQSLSAIPLLIGQDLEPGRVGAARFSDWPFESNEHLGQKNNLENTYAQGLAIGKICSELGVHVNFAPVADVNNNCANPVINDRSFSNNPCIVTQHAINFAQGLSDMSIIACAKHFPGHGDTNVDSHYGLPVIEHTRERLDTIELYPFKQLINTGIPAIMIGHLVVPALEAHKNTPATLSKSIITDLLQKELEFSGLIITDALDMQAITDNYSPGDAELHALRAGNDILLCPVDVQAAINTIKQAVENNLITEQEINTHVEKILCIKNQYANPVLNQTAH